MNRRGLNEKAGMFLRSSVHEPHLVKVPRTPRHPGTASPETGTDGYLVEGSLPPPIASLGTQTGHQAWGTWTLDYGPLAAADSAVEAFPRPAVKAEEENMEK
ncbi:hypothetical protein LA080_014081 [Diaporthe eres]|nr:hypothetical protein LA080_014081 [Diaporthe eres]